MFAVNSDTYITISRPQPDNPAIRPRRDASVASDIVHFPIVDAFIMRPPGELFDGSVYVCTKARLHSAKCLVSRAYTY